MERLGMTDPETPSIESRLAAGIPSILTPEPDARHDDDRPEPADLGGRVNADANEDENADATVDAAPTPEATPEPMPVSRRGWGVPSVTLIGERPDAQQTRPRFRFGRRFRKG